MKEKKLLVVKVDGTAILVDNRDKLSNWMGDEILSIVTEIEIDMPLQVGNTTAFGETIEAIAGNAMLAFKDGLYTLYIKNADGDYIRRHKGMMKNKATEEFMFIGLGYDISKLKRNDKSEFIDELIRIVEELR